MFNLDKKYLYIILVGLALFRVTKYANNPEAIVGLVISLPAVIVAMTFHEFAHAFAADKLGDETPRMQGRVTLNPLAHIDPLGFFMLLFCGFGWGRPVQINPVRFKRDISMSKGEAIVSFAGPLMNMILALIFSLILGAVFKFDLLSGVPKYYNNIIFTLLYQLIFMNIGLGVFNLIPIPPLDGSKVLRHFLPTKVQMWFDNNESILYIIFMVLIFSRKTSLITAPIINIIAKGIMFIVSNIFGIDMILILELLGLL